MGQGVGLFDRQTGSSMTKAGMLGDFFTCLR